MKPRGFHIKSNSKHHKENGAFRGFFGYMLRLCSVHAQLLSSVGVCGVWNIASGIWKMANRRWNIAKVTSVALAILAIFYLPYSTFYQPPQALAAINEQLTFQGRLRTGAKAIVPDGDYNFRFKIYSGGDGNLGGGDETQEWSESYTGGSQVRVENGYFNVRLGSQSSLGSVDFSQDTLWLSMEVGDTTVTPSWDGEMDPFIRLTATPYAFQAQSAAELAQSQGSNTGTLSFDALTADQDILLPDATGVVCLQGESDCGFATGSGQAILQGGNSYSAAMTIGTSDAEDFQVKTDDTVRLTIDSTGNATFVNDVSAANFIGGGADLTDLNASNITSGTLSVDRIADASLTNAKLANSSLGVNSGSGISGGGSISLGGARTLSLGDLTEDWVQSGGYDIVLDNPGAELRMLEANGGAYYGELDIADLNADRLYTFPDMDGEVSILGQVIDNAELANSSLTIDTGSLDSGLSGGGLVSLGGTLTLSTLIGDTVESSEITDGTILEEDLSLTNAPADDYILTYDQASGGFTWVDPSQSGGQLTEAEVEAYIFDGDNTGTLTSGSLDFNSLSFIGVLTDSEISNTLTIGSSSTVADGALSANVSLLGSSIALGSETTGNYVETVTAGNGIQGSGSGVGSTPTIELGALSSDWVQTGGNDIVLDNQDSELVIADSNGFYGTFDVGSLGSDQTYTFLEGGNVLTSSNISSYATTGVTAGSGLTGGGSNGSLTLDIGAGTGINVNSNDISVLYGSTAGTAVEGNTQITVNAGTGLTGGGNITLGAGGSVTLNSELGSDIDTSEIQNGTILEQDLNATNAATDDYVLTYDASSGGFTWVEKSTVAAGGVDSLNTLSGDLTLNGNSQIDVATGGSTIDFSIQADSIGNDQLAFNTGQHLTTTSTPEFGGIKINGQTHYSGNGLDRFTNLATYDTSGTTNEGAIVIHTNIPRNSRMNWIKFQGYQYSSNPVIDLTIAGYWYGTNYTWNNRGYVNNGTHVPDDVQFGVDASDNVVIIIGDTSDNWPYPHFEVSEWVVGTGSASASDASSWEITLETDISAYTNRLSVGNDTFVPFESQYVNVTGDTMTGDLTVNGIVDATTLQGDGSGITGLNASNISSGTLADARLSSNVSLLGQSISSSELVDNSIQEVDLEITNGPTDNYLLSYDSATGGFTWVDSGGVGSQLTENEVEAYVFDGDNTGTLSSGTLALNSLDYTGTLSVTAGGTGASTLGSAGSVAYSDGSVYDFTGVGSSGQCLLSNGSGTPSWGNCGGSGGGAVTLQVAYDNGGSITTTDARDLAFTLANTTTDSDFLIDIASGSTSRFAVQDNGTDELATDSSGTTIRTLTLTNDLTVANGGTGASSFTNGGILYGNGSGALQSTSVLGNGELLIGDGSGAPSVATLTQGSGISISNGSGSITIASTLGTDIDSSEIQDNTIQEVDLEASNSATDNYVLTYDSGTGGFTWVDPESQGSNGVDALNSLTGSISLNGSAQIGVSSAGTNIDLSIQGDSIGDDQLVYNTGQHLTTTSSPDFSSINLDSDGLLRFGGNAGYAYGSSERYSVDVDSVPGDFPNYSRNLAFIEGSGSGFGSYGTYETTKLYTNNAAIQYFYQYNGVNDDTPIRYRNANYNSSGWNAWRSIAALESDQTFSGSNTFTGATDVQNTLSANLFSGSGASLTSLNASNISSGTLADARLSANVSLLGSSIEGSEITNGTITNADIALGTVRSAEIANDTIQEIDLEVTNTATNGYVLTYDSTSGGFTWVDSGTLGSQLTESEVEGYIFDGDNTGTLSSGTLALDSLSYTGDLNDGQINNALTISSSGTVDGAAITASTVANSSLVNSALNVNTGNGLTGGGNIALGGSASLSLSDLTSNWNQTGAYDILLNNAGSELQILESSGGTYYGTFDVGDLSSDQTYTFMQGGVMISSGNIDSYTVTQVSAGNGLTGGGTSGNVTVDVGAGTGITVNANDISVDYGSTAGTAVEGNTQITINASTGLTGGGSLTLGSGGSVSLSSALGTSISSGEIVNGTIQEIDLETTNAATDDYVLTFDSATGGFTWVDGTTASGISESAVEDYIFDGDNTGTLSSGTLALNSLSYTGTLSVSHGGTGLTSAGPAGSIAYSDGTAFGFTSAGSSGDCLLSNGTGTPSWGECGDGGGVTTLQGAYDNGNSLTTTNARDVIFNLADTTTDSSFIVNMQGTTNLFDVQNAGTSVLTADANGNVGIGDSTPSYKLDVNGTGRFTNDLLVNGNATLGNANTDTLTINGTDVAIPNSLNFDSNTLYVDSSSNRVAIGTNSFNSTEKLKISGGTSADVWFNIAGSSDGLANEDVGLIGGTFFGTTFMGSSTNHKLFLRANNNDQVAIDPAGYVGINELSPAAPLHVKQSGSNAEGILLNGTGTTNPMVRLQNDGTEFGALFNLDANGNNDLTVRSQGDLRLNGGGNTSGTHLVVDSTGNVGIGTAAPGDSLQIANGGIEVSNGGICLDNDGNCGSSAGGITLGPAGIKGSDSAGSEIYLQDNTGIGISNPLDNLDVSGNVRIRGGQLKTNGSSLRFLTNTTDDTSYEWTGWYSGNTRQAIMLWDGSWSGCGSGSSTFCFKAEGNDLKLASDNTVQLYSNTGASNATSLCAGSDTISIQEGNGCTNFNGAVLYVSGDTRMWGSLYVNSRIDSGDANETVKLHDGDNDIQFGWGGGCGGNFRIRVDTTCFSNYSTTSSWVNGSSRETKENFESLDPQSVLNKISALEMTRWNYKNEDQSIKHIGPIAEDFYEKFGLGNNNKSVSTIDPAGVALVGIQALNANVASINSEIDTLHSQVDVALQNGDSANLANLTVNGTLTVKNNATFSKDVLIKGKLKVADVETQKLTVNGHILNEAVAATVENGSVLGAEAETAIDGTDTAGTVTITTDDVNDSGELATITFNKPYENTPRISLTPLNGDAAGIAAFVERTEDGFVIKTNNSVPSSAELIFDYIIIGSDVATES